ncbi:MAG TPA: hypothetical protein H9825_00080 [Candidatus Sphingobacterium stercorigallinarum]|nr:hypothetical protein [Candidatus Sphingobacterium stercorigallinarum]
MKQSRLLSTALITVITLSMPGCKKDTPDIDYTSMEGTWKLIGQNMGLPDGYVSVAHGELFTLSKDSTFRKGTSTCDHGAYSISKSHITLDYSCKNKASMLSEGVQHWGYTLKNGILALSPTFLNCAEGCSYHYKKISNH